MKKTILGFIGILFAVTSFAQTDSVEIQKKNDTIRIGGMVILKKEDSTQRKRINVTIGNRHRRENSNISTASFIIDLGFANWVDKTNYTSATNDGYIVNRPGTPTVPLVQNDFKLKTIKSVNVNIWFYTSLLSFSRMREPITHATSVFSL